MKKQGIDSIVNILMRRDHLTRQEAVLMVRAVKQDLMAALTGESGENPEEVLAMELGLEPDYLFDLI